ncbi:MAG: SDR family NAD(P)-dependent oxidoreductase [Sphingobacteriales bacterium]|nr:SDR family NAD(P)-dependent oxidoreductase [Sphingobacteriales bacterium]
MKKTVIITGASGNMGQAVVKKFLSGNYNVVGTIIPNDPVPMEIINDSFEKVIVDLMSEDDSKRFVESVISKNGGINAAVLTVGGFAMNKIADTTTSDILKQYKLNFETAYNIARPVFVQMMKQGYGRIFLVGSRPGLDVSRHGKGMAAYSLAKSLIFRLAELMNAEAKDQNVVTSVIVPSTIDTPQNRKAMPDANFDSWVKPEDIANSIYYYCTDEAAALREPVIKLYNKA